MCRIVEVACFATLACGWMPFTHLAIAGRNRTDSFCVGLIAPDAFSHKFFGTAAYRQKMHSIDFVAELLALAHGDATMTNLALGWGCHLVADHVGHDGEPAYLKNSYSVELAVDAWMSRNEGVELGDVQLPVNVVADPRLAAAVGYDNVTEKDVERQWNKFVTAAKIEANGFWLVRDWMLEKFSVCTEPAGVKNALKQTRAVCSKWLEVDPSWSAKRIRNHGRDVIAFAQTLLPLCGKTLERVPLFASSQNDTYAPVTEEQKVARNDTYAPVTEEQKVARNDRYSSFTDEQKVALFKFVNVIALFAMLYVVLKPLFKR